MKRERNGGHGREGVCACVFRQVREKGLIVGLAAHVLHLEEIASLAHLSPLPSAVIISIAKSKLADLMFKTSKLNSAAPMFFLVTMRKYYIRQCHD